MYQFESIGFDVVTDTNVIPIFPSTSYPSFRHFHNHQLKKPNNGIDSYRLHEAIQEEEEGEV